MKTPSQTPPTHRSEESGASSATASNAVAQLLDALRERGGLKSTDVANVADVSPATVSHWITGKAVPAPKAQLLIDDLHYAVSRLAEFYAPGHARLWLHAKHRLLAGARPIDLVRAGRSAAVLRVIESMSGSAYT